MNNHPHRRLKKWVTFLAACSVAALGPLTLLPAVGWSWPVELLTHFQLQYFLAAIALAVMLAGLRRWWWALAAVACAAVSGSSIAPFTSAEGAAHAVARASAADGSIRVLLANVLVRNDQHERMLELASAADADVLIFQEVDDRWLEALAPLRRTHPYTVGRARDDAFGIAVFSRVPFDDSDVENLVAGGRPSIGLDLSVDGRPVTLLATHPTHPVSPRTFRLRNEQLEALAAFIRGRSGPVVLVGDLNVTMWSPWYRRLCDETELVNARRGFGVLPSWPTFLPVVGRVPIDHCLVSDDVVVSDCRLGPPVGSDHLPLIVDLVIPE